MKGVFVTGTSTHVGKTVVSAGLAFSLARKRRRVGVMKPVATGSRKTGAYHMSDDTVMIRMAAGNDLPPDLVTPINFREPLSPHMAARIQNVTFTPEHARETIMGAFQTLSERHDILIVEGIGGFLVPITDRYTIGDVAAEMGLPLLIVGDDRLGVVSHTLLVIEAAQRRGLPVAGVLLNRTGISDYAAATNREALSYATDVPVFGPLPCLLDPDNPAPMDFDKLADALEKTGVVDLLTEDA